jgi:hypothetical protein
MRSLPLALPATLVVCALVTAGILLPHSEQLSFAAPAEAPEETRVIPLQSCYATFAGSGCKVIRRDRREPYGYDLEQLFQDHKGGASNVVVVRGNDIGAAVRATRWAFTTGRSAEEPVSPYLDGREGKGELLWLAAYVGSGSSTPVWGVRAAELKGRMARLPYYPVRPPNATNDQWHYFVWVPLGEPKTGTYTVELSHAERQEATLLRRVRVLEP